MGMRRRRQHTPSLERLWAPWRSRFVSHRGPRRCFFCVARPGGARRDRAHHVVGRGRRVLCILNRYPYSNGHLLIAPYRHVGRLDRLTEAEWMELFEMSRLFIKRLERRLRPGGFNVGFNLGRSAGAGLPGHAHLHIVPRWVGDTNFLPVLGGVKVISQSLEELYRVLRRP